MAEQATNGIVVAQDTFPTRARRVLRRMRRMPLIPATILVVMVFCAITADWISPHPPKNGDLSDRILPPIWGGETYLVKTVVDQVEIGQRYRQVAVGTEEFNEAKARQDSIATKDVRTARNFVVGDKIEVKIRDAGTSKYPLGTDHLGRDMLSRLFHGARISLVVAAVALGVGGTIGTFFGMLSGYYGGWVDELLMRVVDIFMSLPYLLVALVLVVSIGQSFELIVGVLAVFIWPFFARVVRGEVLQLRTMDYIALARVSGAGTLRILVVHLFPGVINTLIVIATLQVGVVILVEAALSFLGAGVPPPTPAWGSMVADGRDRLVDGWWIATLPGLAIVFTVVSLNIFGDWLRDTLDPRLRQLN